MIRITGIRPLLYWLPLLLCIALLFQFSSQSYEQQTIIPFLQKYMNEGELTKLLPNIAVKYGDRIFMLKWQPFHFFEFLFRKAAHFLVYAMLAGLFFLAMFPWKLKVGWKAAIVLLAIVSAAALDEWNQTMRVHRNGEAIDVGLDLIGGFAGLLVSMAILYALRKRKVRER